jgi:hypothetical protein
MGSGVSREDPALADVLKAALGMGGMAMCLVLVFRGMRAVMDVGGACADGGPYVSAQSCPEGAPVALMAGIFGLLLFGAISMVYAGRLGGLWGAAPLLAWTGLFGSLGWNFLDYGLFNPPLEADGIVWGWIIPGVIFEVMAFAPLLVIPFMGSSRLTPARRRGLPKTAQTSQVVLEPSPAAEFREGTQALLDRLERLGDMRDHGLLTVEEFETAKAAVVAELEERA